MAYPFRSALRRLLPRPIALALRKEWLARQVAGGRGYVETDVGYLPRFVSSTDVCWDIGASSGTYAVALGRCAGTVHAFEPVAHSRAVLARTIALSRLANVHIHHEAVADRVGRARITVPVDGFYGGFYRARLDEAGDQEVAVTTIDRLIADGVPAPDFIKCDVEGAERQVIEGARGLLGRARPIWLLETFEEGPLTTLRSLGYRAYVLGPEGPPIEVEERVPSARNYWLVPSRRVMEAGFGSGA